MSRRSLRAQLECRSPHTKGARSAPEPHHNLGKPSNRVAHSPHIAPDRRHPPGPIQPDREPCRSRDERPSSSPRLPTSQVKCSIFKPVRLRVMMVGHRDAIILPSRSLWSTPVPVCPPAPGALPHQPSVSRPGRRPSTSRSVTVAEERPVSVPLSRLARSRASTAMTILHRPLRTRFRRWIQDGARAGSAVGRLWSLLYCR